MRFKYEHCPHCGRIGGMYLENDEVHCLYCGYIKYNVLILYRWKDKKIDKAKPDTLPLPKR